MKSFKNFITEKKKYSMKQAIDWFAGDAKDVAWTMSSKSGKRGDPEVGHWLDMSSGEVVLAKEKNPPKGVKVYKEEGKKGKEKDWALQKDLMNKGYIKPKKTKNRKKSKSDDESDWALQKDLMNKGYAEEANPTATPDVVGTGDDVADWKDPKKKKRRPLTRHFIEVGGKRRKLTK